MCGFGQGSKFMHSDVNLLDFRFRELSNSRLLEVLIISAKLTEL